MGSDPSQDTWHRDNKESHLVGFHIFPSPAVSALAFWERKKAFWECEWVLLGEKHGPCRAGSLGNPCSPELCGAL